MKLTKDLKALSIQQPWAWVIFRPDLSKADRMKEMGNGLIKDVENRAWKYKPNYRGPLLIHASKTFDYDGWEWIQKTFPTIPLPPDHVTTNHREISQAFNRGGFVGLCRMNDVVTEDASQWFFGPMGFKIRMPQPIHFVPYKGQLGLFDVPEKIITEIHAID